MEVAMAEVRIDVTGHVAIVTLNRPGRRNAISARLLAALREALADLDARPDVRAIVLTGADPAFCAGLDLTELGQAGGPLANVAAGPVIPELATPLIGAVNGPAVTGGLELALACDFLIASERARFADTHARIGVLPGWGLTVALPEAVGMRRAREMSATGNFVTARTALEWGLVNHVVPHAELMTTAVGLAGDIGSNDPGALRAIFATYDEAARSAAKQAQAIETRAHARWHSGGIDAARVAARRDAVISRGRSQG
jgi:enoyl-CoA hydratase